MQPTLDACSSNASSHAPAYTLHTTTTTTTTTTASMVSFAATEDARYPANVGIVGLDAYFPRTYVDQVALGTPLLSCCVSTHALHAEQHDGVSAGKYTIGLGQLKMAFCSDREDIQSICLTGTLPRP
jgi:hypothetical protein